MHQQTIVLEVEVEKSDKNGSSRYRVEVSGVEHDTRKIAEELLDKLKGTVPQRASKPPLEESVARLEEVAEKAQGKTE